LCSSQDGSTIWRNRVHPYTGNTQRCRKRTTFPRYSIITSSPWNMHPCHLWFLLQVPKVIRVDPKVSSLQLEDGCIFEWNKNTLSASMMIQHMSHRSKLRISKPRTVSCKIYMYYFDTSHPGLEIQLCVSCNIHVVFEHLASSLEIWFSVRRAWARANH